MTIRIGFLGTGFMGQLAHLYSFSRVPDCEIVALAEARPKLGKQVAKQHSIPSVYTSHEALLEDDSVEAVVASQPYQRNYYLGREVLKAGKALFTEKPMAATFEDAQELVALAEQNHVVYAVGFMKRYDPGVQLARSQITDFEKSGELGNLRMVDTTCFLGDWLQNPGQPIKTDEPSPDDLQPRYPAYLHPELREVYHHFINVYSHNINLLHFLLPDRTIECESAHRSGGSFLVALRAGEVLVSVRGAPSRSHQWEEYTSLYFERGRVELKSASPLNRQKVADVSVWRETNGTWGEQRLFPSIEWAFFRQAKAFVAAVAYGDDIPTRGDKCLNDVALMEDIFRKLK